jgi:hypothetical protein
VTCGRRLGYLLESLEDNTRGIEVRAASMERDSRGWGNTHLSRGMTLLAMRRPEAALADLSPAVESLERAVGATHRFTLTARLMRMVALAQVGRTDQGAGRGGGWRNAERSTPVSSTTRTPGRCTGSPAGRSGVRGTAAGTAPHPRRSRPPLESDARPGRGAG